MNTIEITSIQDVQVGDVANLSYQSRSDRQVTGEIVRIDLPVLTLSIDDDVYANVQLDTSQGHWEFVSATREVPEVAWGTAGYATVRGRVKERVMRVAYQGQKGYCEWMTPSLIGDAFRMHTKDDVHSFVPDDIEALRADLDAARTQVSDLTSRNAALEKLVQEQKQGIQARDTWIEDQAADA